MSMAGDVDVSSLSGSAAFGDGVSVVSGGEMVMSSSGEFVSVASSVDVRGSEGVRVGSVGSAIDLSDGDVLVSASG
eukprot:COSAG04_NODE_32498_length_243_cov_1344.340278_1_plen_75_part_10